MNARGKGTEYIHISVPSTDTEYMHSYYPDGMDPNKFVVAVAEHTGNNPEDYVAPENF